MDLLRINYKEDNWSSEDLIDPLPGEARIFQHSLYNHFATRERLPLDKIAK